MLQHGALHLDLAGALHHELQIEVGQLLLLHLLLGRALHVRRLDGGRLARRCDQDAGTVHRGIDAGIVGGAVIEDAGDKGDDHRDDGGADDERKDNFGGAVVLLQNADHAWLTTFTSGGSRTETSLPGIFAHGWGTVSCETHHSCAQGLIAKYKSGAGAWQDWFRPKPARRSQSKRLRKPPQPSDLGS